MHYIILIAILLLLTVVLLTKEKEKENFFWGKILILFSTFLLSLEIGFVRIPLGIIIAFILVIKFSKYNRSLKHLTLLFSLVGFMLIQFVPSTELNDVLYSKEIYNQMDRFETIEYVKIFSNDAVIQEKIKKYDEDSTDIMFKTYMLMENDISIKDKDWLLYDSHDELNFYWQSQTTESEKIRTSETSSRSYGIAWEDYIRDNNTGEEYIGVFKRENDEIYVKLCN
ncbi:hypothetical protein ACFQ3N_14950 [Virgibacillus byunsanensis]|uniref:Uncharacterized protein n=1 Tax=Virgibacillus byunsanensis TaxID=570945 RepID=A0ABW3LRP2_9BACI